MPASCSDVIPLALGDGPAGGDTPSQSPPESTELRGLHLLRDDEGSSRPCTLPGFVGEPIQSPSYLRRSETGPRSLHRHRTLTWRIRFGATTGPSVSPTPQTFLSTTTWAGAGEVNTKALACMLGSTPCRRRDVMIGVRPPTAERKSGISDEASSMGEAIETERLCFGEFS